MFVKKIYLSNFRNYSYAEIDLKEGTNVIYGANAKGKTNILEAVCVMSTVRSHRGAKENEMIMFGKERSAVKIEYSARQRMNIGKIIFSKDKKRQALLNGVYAAKTSEIIGNLKTVIFCPEDLKLVKGSPGERRRMMDLGICQLRQKYFHSLSTYYKILEQRNKLLKENPESEMLWVWDEKLIDSGTDIVWYRYSYIEQLSVKVKEILKNLSGENIDISYSCGFECEDFKSKEKIKDSFKKELEENIEREKKFGISLVGPHRDDFKIFLDGFLAKHFASQGQQRSVALSLKMAEASLISDDTGETPVLLLDDVLSDLDESRRSYILNNIKGMQVVITCTEKELLGKIPGVNLINVENIGTRGD